MIKKANIINNCNSYEEVIFLILLDFILNKIINFIKYFIGFCFIK